MSNRIEFVKPSLSDMSTRSGQTVTLSWESTPKLKGGKKNLQQGRITKLSTAEVTLGGTGMYATRKVNEGEFTSSDEVHKRTWGVRVGNSSIIEHKGNEYVEFFLEGKPKTSYFQDGLHIDKADIEGLSTTVRDTKVMICTVKAQNVKIMAVSD